MAERNRVDTRVRLSAEGVQEVVKAFRQVEREGARSGRSVENTFKSLGRLLPAISFAAITAGLTALAKSTLGAIDDLSKLAQKTGVATETLTAYAHGANLAGANTETLAKGLGKLARTANDAANGLKTAQRPFQQLGISVQDSQGGLRPLEDLLGDVAEKFAGMEDGTRKAALAQELFGRSGVQLIPFLNQGRAGLGAMRAEAERLGLVIDSQTAKSVEEFNDNLTRLQARLQGAAIQVINQNIPGLLAMSEALLQLAGDAEKAGSDVTAGLFNKFVLFGFGMEAVLDNVVAVAEVRFRQLAALAAGRPFEAHALEAVRASIPDVSTAFQEGMLEGIQVLESLRDAAKKAAGSQEGEDGIHGIGTAAKKAKFELVKLDDLFAGIGQRPPSLLRPGELTVPQRREEFLRPRPSVPLPESLIEDQDRLLDVFRQAEQVFERTRTAEEVYNAELARLGEMLRVVAIDQDTYNRAVQQAQEDFQRAKEQASEFGRAMASLNQTLTTDFLKADALFAVQGALAQFFTSGIQNAESFGDAMRQLALSVVQSLQQIAAQFLATKLVTSIFGSFQDDPAAQIATAAAAGTAQATPLIAASAALDTSGAVLIGAGGTLVAGGATLTTSGPVLIAGGGTILAGAIALGIAAAALQVAATTLLIANSVGGGLLGFADGGLVYGPGSGTSDSIPAWLSRGEIVIREAVASQPGMAQFLLEVNRHGWPALELARSRYGFADGGLVETLGGLDFGGGRGGDGANGRMDVTLGLSEGLVVQAFEASSAVDRVLIRKLERNRKAVNAALGHNAI